MITIALACFGQDVTYGSGASLQLSAFNYAHEACLLLLCVPIVCSINVNLIKGVRFGIVSRLTPPLT